MTQPKSSSGTTTAISITLPNSVKRITDLVLTPPGIVSVPKGSYSQLLTSLLYGYLENTFETDLFTIQEVCSDNPNITLDDLRAAIAERKEVSQIL